MRASACKGKSILGSVLLALRLVPSEVNMPDTCSNDSWKRNEASWEAWKIWRVSVPWGCHLDSDHIALLLTPSRVLRTDPGSSLSDASHPTVHRMAHLHLDVKLVWAFSPALLLYRLEFSREAEPIGWGHTHTHTHTHTCMRTHTHVHTRTCTHTRACIHTQLSLERCGFELQRPTCMWMFFNKNNNVLRYCRIQHWLSLRMHNSGFESLDLGPLIQRGDCKVIHRFLTASELTVQSPVLFKGLLCTRT